MGQIAQQQNAWGGRRSARSAPVHAGLLALALLLSATARSSAQTVSWDANSPVRFSDSSFTVSKTASATSFTAQRGGTLEIPYTITVSRVLSASANLAFTLSCTGKAGAATATAKLGPATPATTPAVANQCSLQEGPAGVYTCHFALLGLAPPPDAIPATCVIDGETTSSTITVAYPNAVNPAAGAVTLKDVITWPNWAAFVTSGSAAAMTTTVRGDYPGAGRVLDVNAPFPQTFSYTWTLNNINACFSQAQVSNVATLLDSGGAVINSNSVQVAVGVAGCSSPGTSPSVTTGSYSGSGGGQAFVTWDSSSPAKTETSTWKLTKTTTAPTVSVTRGGDVEIPYTITVDRTVSTTASLAFTLCCSGLLANTAAAAGTPPTATVDSPSPATNPPMSSTCQLAWSSPNWCCTLRLASLTPPPASFNAKCDDSARGGPVTTSSISVSYTTTTSSPPGPITLSDVVTWPTWSSYYPAGNWLTTAPTPVVSGAHPGASRVISTDGSATFPQIFTYKWTLRNVVLCFAQAQVTNTATLTDGRNTPITTANAATLLSVGDCDVVPTFSLGTPLLQTSIQYAWANSITPVDTSALSVPWGGGGTVRARGTFTRTVTSVLLTATFQLQITNPVNAPIALTNLQLSCPWGGNTYLPCGTLASGGINGVGVAANSLLMIPARGTVSCAVNNMQLQGMWGVDFTQPCSIMTSNWLGTAVQYNGLVLNFAAPTRWLSINNCAQWTVTCTPPGGNAFWQPQIGGLPNALQICGNDNTNAPIPDQMFDISLGAGWIGDGTQPAACASPVTTSCNSQLQLQSTAGTSQTYGSTQVATLAVTATPINCPRAPPSPRIDNNGNGNNGAPQPSPASYMSTSDPVITPVVTRTYVKGTFQWTAASAVSPAAQPMPQGGPGVPGRYTLTANRESAPGAEPAQYQIEGVVSVTNPAQSGAMRVEGVAAVVDGAAVPLTCAQALPLSLPPGGKVDCGFIVNYNQGPAPNVVSGRATIVSDAGVRLARDSAAGARFSFESADFTAASGACARVVAAFASNWLSLTQTDGEAPSFLPDAPTTVCAPTTWTFDVVFSPKDDVPCGPQPVISTLTATYVAGGVEVSRQGTSTAILDMTGPSCPGRTTEDPALGSSSGGGTGTGSSGGGSSSGGGTGSSGGNSGGDGSSSDQSPASTGLSVRVADVSSRRSEALNWALELLPVEVNVTKPAGQKAVVEFELSFNQSSQPVTDYSGVITIANAGSELVEFDSVTLELADLSGATAGAANADCPLPGNGSAANSPAAVSSSRTLKLEPGSSVNCTFTLSAAAGGALTAIVTDAASGQSTTSPERAVTSLLSLDADEDGSCARLVYGLAASALGERGMLIAGNNGTQEEEVCTAGLKTIKFTIPRDASTGNRCVFPVVAAARITPPDGSFTQAVAASGAANVVIAGCEPAADAPTASVPELRVTKARFMNWSVELETFPAVDNGSFVGEAINISATYSQGFERGQFLTLAGDVLIQGSSKVTKAKVHVLPLCTPASEGCEPVELEVTCLPDKLSPDGSNASRCAFLVDKQPAVSGLLLPAVEGARPAAAQPYEAAKATREGRPRGRCALLDIANSLRPADGGADAKAATVLSTPTNGALNSTTQFCEASKLFTAVLEFGDLECGKRYTFSSRATATPQQAPGVAPAEAAVSFDVTC